MITLEVNGSHLPIVGIGGSGLVVHCVATAIKFARDCYSDEDLEDDETIEHEKKVYRRLKNCGGTVECLDLSSRGFRMVYMEKGNLYQFPSNTTLRTHRSCPGSGTWLAILRSSMTGGWLSQTFEPETFCWSIRFSDFTESSLLTPECDIQTAEDGGFSI